MRNFLKALGIASSAVMMSNAASAVAQSPQPTSSANHAIAPDAEIQRRLDGMVAAGHAKGLVFGLIRPDGSRGILTAGSAGDGRPALDGGSAFEIGSITKTFTGVLLAEAVRRGEVQLSDPLAKHLPSSARVPTRGGKQITLLDLAAHRSGLPKMPTGWTPADASNPYAAYRSEDLLAFLGSYELTRDIGATPEYSNYGAALLGIALANAAGAKDYKALVKDRIIDPLRLTATGFDRSAVAARLTAGHDPKGKPVPYWDVQGFAGAGGLYSTADDLLKYLDAHIGPPASPLEQAMRAAATPHQPLKQAGWQMGLGWQIRDRGGYRTISHGGATGGYGAFIAFEPASGAAAVLLANTDDFDGDFLLNLLAPQPRVVPPAGANGVATNR